MKNYHAEHIVNVLTSYHQLVGKMLIEPAGNDEETAEKIYQAPFFLATHGTEDDPIFNYANLYAQELFEMDWKTFTSTPSRLSAEQPNREERSMLLHEVSKNGFIENYAGVRIASSGKRFLIKKATVWNVQDQQGNYIGQAATFSNWEYM